MQKRTVSVTGAGDSPWLRLDDWAGGQIGFQAVPSGTVSSYSVLTTFDDPNDPFNPVAVPTWDSQLSGVNLASSAMSGFILCIPAYIKATIVTGTGTVALTVSQSLNAPF